MSSEPNLATLSELNTIYDITQLYDFIEMLDMKDELAAITREDMEAADKAKKAKDSQNNNRR